MIRKTASLLSHLRGTKTALPTSWPMLRGPKAPRAHLDVPPSGESGPVTPEEMERFREDPEHVGADPRFFGKRLGDYSEDFG